MSALQDAVNARNLALVEAAVPFMDQGDGLSTNDIWQRVGCWSLIGLRGILNRLSEQGRVIREPGIDQLLWRRTPPHKSNAVGIAAPSNVDGDADGRWNAGITTGGVRSGGAA